MTRRRAAAARMPQPTPSEVPPAAAEHVADSRSAPELRPVNVPVPVAVALGADGEPAWVLWRGHRLRVVAVLDRWRIDDEWWRTPVSRLYRRLHVDGDRLLTVFEDLERGGWYAQRYRYPTSAAERTATRRRRRHLHG